jgi:hypothetical protein
MMERVATTVSYKSQSMAATLKFIPPGNWGGAEKYEPIRGHFPGADSPLAVAQIDHTPRPTNVQVRCANVQARYHSFSPEEIFRQEDLSGRTLTRYLLSIDRIRELFKPKVP